MDKISDAIHVFIEKEENNGRILFKTLYSNIFSLTFATLILLPLLLRFLLLSCASLSCCHSFCMLSFRRCCCCCTTKSWCWFYFLQCVRVHVYFFGFKYVCTAQQHTFMDTNPKRCNILYAIRYIIIIIYICRENPILFQAVNPPVRQSSSLHLCLSICAFRSFEIARTAQQFRTLTSLIGEHFEYNPSEHQRTMCNQNAMCDGDSNGDDNDTDVHRCKVVILWIKPNSNQKYKEQINLMVRQVVVEKSSIKKKSSTKPHRH